MLRNITKFLRRQFRQGTEIDENNISVAVYIGTYSHAIYFFIHKYVLFLKGSVIFSAIAASLCLISGFHSKLSPKIQQKYFPFYWHIMLIFMFPLTISYMTILNGFSGFWLILMIVMPIILSVFIPNWFTLLFDLIIGILVSCLFYTYKIKGDFVFAKDFEFSSFLGMFVFSTLIGIIFVNANRKTWLNKQKNHYQEILTSAISILQTARYPINSTVLCSKDIIKTLDSEERANNEIIKNFSSNISKLGNQINEIVNYTLTDLKEKGSLIHEFQFIKPQILSEVIERIGFYNEKEKQKIQLDLTNNPDFFFKVIVDRFDFVIANLIKNILFHIKEVPNSTVKISTETRVLGKKFYKEFGKEFCKQELNVIYFQEDYVGIKKELIPTLFDNPSNTEKEIEISSGLLFCRKNMRIFGGEIICESESKDKNTSWTKFSLLFPKVTSEDLAQNQIQKEDRINQDSQSPISFDLTIKAKYPILIVDDQKSNLIYLKAEIEQNLDHIECEFAESGAEAIMLVKENNYKLVMMDIQMPEMDGMVAARKIRAFNNKIPIVAYTSLEHESIKTALNQYFDGYLQKPANLKTKMRLINKMIFYTQDNLHYAGDSKYYLKSFKGKKFILADDQEVNRKILKRKFELLGVEVSEASNGKELIDIYSKSLKTDNDSSQTIISGYDLIVTDINMPELNGDKASIKIRQLEENYKIKFDNHIPIIAMSANNEETDIKSFFKSQMDDYFIKGSESEKLDKIISIYLKGKEEDQNQTQEEPSKEVQDEIKSKVVKKETSDPRNDYEEKNENLKNEIQIKSLNLRNIESFSEQDRKSFLISFLRDSVTILKKIEVTLGKEKDEETQKDLNFLIHALRGIAGNIGAEKLFMICKKVESDFRENKTPKDDWYMEIRNEHHLVHQIIQKIIS